MQQYIVGGLVYMYVSSTTVGREREGERMTALTRVFSERDTQD